MTDRLSEDDAALALLAKSGDESALGRLICSYEPLIRRRASRFHVSGLDADDLAQEGMIGLIHAIRSFDTAKSASFHAYALVCITTKIISAVRVALRKKQQPLNGYISLDDANAAVPAACSSVVDPEDMVLRREMIRVVNHTILNCLTPVERRVLSLYLSGFHYAVIAKKLLIGEKQVDNALQRVRRKLGLKTAG